MMLITFASRKAEKVIRLDLFARLEIIQKYLKPYTFNMPKENKTEWIRLRIEPSKKAALQKKADKQNKTLTDFLIDAGMKC